MTRDKFLYAALALTLINLAYWTAYNINAYSTFHLSEETAIAALSLYYATHTSLLHGLQFLAMATHLAPDQMLLMPIFYFFPSALTLMLAKVFILCASGLLLFFIAREFTKSPLFSLSLAFAYFINPGTVAMQLYEYHVELLLVPLYLLTFYFCMSLKKKWFYLSLFLLLGTFETSVSIVACLGLGILAYEYLHDKQPKSEMGLNSDSIQRREAEKKERIKLAVLILVCSFLALIFYNLLYASLQGSYSSTISPNLIDVPYPFVPLFNSASYAYSTGFPNAVIPTFLAYIVGIVIMGFGAISAFAILPLLIFIAPWLGGVFILHNAEFLFAWRYSYMISGVVIGAMLGYPILMRRFPKLPATQIMLLSAALCSWILVPAFFFSPLTTPSQEVAFFQINQNELVNYAQLRSIMALVPGNASIMTQFNLYPYFANRQYDELIYGDHFFKPEYILADANVSAPLAGVDESAALENYLASSSYSISARNGSAILWKAVR